MAVIAEFYNGGRHVKYVDRLARWTSIAVLDVDEHRAIFADAGFEDVHVDEDGKHGWICVYGSKPECRLK